MNLVRLNPTRTINPFINEFFAPNWNAPTKLFSPATNIKENEKSTTIEIAVPGFNKTDFNIEVDNKNLIISATIESEEKCEENCYCKQEYTKQSFSKSFLLPENLQEDKITASYKEGILSLEIPRKKEKQAEAKKLITVS